MQQHKKLFNRSEIEYITPFLKLWIAFNGWYKQDTPRSITTDRRAINYYKEQGKKGKVGKHFLSILDTTAGEKLHNILCTLIDSIQLHPIKKDDKQMNYFIKEGNNKERNLILGFRGDERQNRITLANRHQIMKKDEVLFFQSSLEIIYQIRCLIVHGDFDIEDSTFLKLVECVYEILYIVMNKIIEEEADGEFVCSIKKRKVDAIGRYNDGKMTVLSGSEVAKDVSKGYLPKQGIRMSQLKGYAEAKSDHYFITKDIEFSSPSAAASFCLGRIASGLSTWKTKNGKTMGDFLKK